ncbi:MAG: OB-fold domain-containing protein [Sphingomonas sp.]|nr:OB-fold domain-containing protein [Sphingomonas sp.]
MPDVGITGYGTYLPRRRLCRKTVAEAQAWLAPGLKANGKGTRALAGWDEDTVTMAVEAARACLGPGDDRAHIGGLHFASTTPVFIDRLNAGIVAAALTLGEEISASDQTGTRRAGTTALLQAIDSAAARGGTSLVVASEKRKARAASAQELAYGDGAACITVGTGPVIARLIGRHSLTIDFVDRFRAAGAEYEYLWEERWAREEGYGEFVPRAIAAVLRDAGIAADQIVKLILPCPFRGLAATLAAKAGLSGATVVDDHSLAIGDLGTANALMLLAASLETAQPGEKILVVDFGQGCEAFILEVTDAIAGFRPARRFADQLAGGVLEQNYLRYLTTRDLIDWDKGPKAERDTRTSLSGLYRNRAMLLGFVGGRHRETGEVQFPASRIALGETGHAIDALEPYKFAERQGQILSWSADRMALTPDPPNYYGMITFPEGGRLMMDITDVLGADVQTGMAVRMVFRIKDVDAPRDYTRYFWKATLLQPDGN